VKLVLHDELGRAQPLGQHLRARAATGPSGVPKNCRPSRECDAAEEHPRLGAPRHHRKLVHRRHQKRRQLAVHLLVDKHQGQALVGVALVALAEVTPAEVLAQQGDVGGRLFAGCRVAVSGSRSKPHQGQFVNGSGDGAVLLLRCFFHAVIFSLTSARVLAVAVRPTQSPTLKRTAPSVSGVAAAQRLQRAHQRRRALKLVEGEQPQGVPQQHRHAVAAVGSARARAGGAAPGRRRSPRGTPRSCRRPSGRR
jgi:hypothetical protein